VQLGSDEHADYVLDLVELAERYGIVLDLPTNGQIEIQVEHDGTLRFGIVGYLPDGRQPPLAVIELNEKWRPAARDRHERSAYRYELLDRERGFRRAFHWHDEREFVRRFGVVVHEHCEEPIGHATCAHHFGPPVRDGFRAVELLMAAWIADPPDCTELPCLESI
jgi:hypothetical protein